MKLSHIKFEAPRSITPLLSDFLLGLGSNGVAEDISGEDSFEISAYFPMDADLADIIHSLKEYVTILGETFVDAGIGPLTAEHIDRSHWEVWKSLLKTVRAGRKVIIRPPWEEYTPDEQEIVIEINPSMAFGTGHHETTRLCIAAIEQARSSGNIGSMLDVGCGSGILSITAAKMGIARIVGLDTDPVAIGESLKNARVNGVSDKILFFCGYVQSAKGRYDLIVANVYIAPILLMREELRSRLNEKGRLVISGIPHIRAKEAVDGLQNGGLVLTEEKREGDWMSFTFKTG